MTIVATALGALTLIGCGSDRTALPTAPSNLAAAAGGAIVTGRVQPLERGDGLTVTALVANTACPTLQFKVNSYVIKTDASTRYEGGACVDIVVGAKLSVSGTRPDERDQIFTASEISFRRAGTGDDLPEAVDGEAPVTSLVVGTSCPALSFLIGPYKISVTGTTTFERGTCEDIKAGVRLEVKGTRTGTNIAASGIEFKEAGTSTERAEGEGIITGLKTGTSCPALTFFVESKQVDVTAATVFERGVCADLAIGKRVHVRGTRVGEDRFTATSIIVQADSPGHPVVEGDARVTSLVSATACPTLTFKIEEWTVTVDASTLFTGGVCADIAAGRRLGVKGTVTGEHQVLATKIVFKTDDDN